ncbi:hypothetical protein SNE40_015250 [Patella caerulea]|uniref:guanylate cyclase n=1 Tax=Patella caerulea TaxID=87958 RepID=A0AAN8PEF5_PATCE
MYGQIHCVVRELVQEKFGQETWETILEKSGLDEHAHFLVFCQYDDVQTFKLVGAVAECLNLPLTAVLEVFGDYFLIYCLRHGYDKMLKTLGSDMWSFIQNLDSLHSLLALSYKNITPPSFRCETGEDGSLLLHYYTIRPGLYPIVIGLVKAVGRDIFNQTVDITVLEQSEETIGDKNQQHTVFNVILQDGLHSREVCPYQRQAPEGEESEKKMAEICPVMSGDTSFQLNAQQFCSAFPYHIIFDSNMCISQCGTKIQKLSPVLITPHIPMEKVLAIDHPKMELNIENIKKFINSVFFLSICNSNKDNPEKTFTLKGQMIWLEDSGHMIFIGSPRITSLNELMDMNVYLSDIPLYDVTRELVLLNQQRIAEIDVAKKLDETTVQLKKTSKALECEKEKTDMLLYQMLPQKVANQLKNGKQVEAEKYDQVTILFSDIVTFTSISAACAPLDIVNMLNDLYQRFDEKTTQHGVYKVETIGDAYMVVCGVPERSTNHAAPVSRFSIDMLLESAQVKSPATGRPLQIRIGIHTGPVVAGVVGRKMPRYCLFGDTVNTASRMESHGLPGRIHISPTTHQALKTSRFLVKEREEINVKGKGKMTTHFLVGEKSMITEPQDKYCKVKAKETDSVKSSGARIIYGQMDPSINESKTCSVQ